MGASGGILAGHGQASLWWSPSLVTSLVGLLVPDTLGCLSPALPRRLTGAKVIKVWKNHKASVNLLLPTTSWVCRSFHASSL